MQNFICVLLCQKFFSALFRIVGQFAQNTSRMARFNGSHLARSADGDNLATCFATFGSYVNDVVGNLDDVRVVLDNDNRVSLIDEFVQYVEQLSYILEV